MDGPQERTDTAGRVLIVSNRLPVTLRTQADGGVAIEPSAGGLATGLQGVHGNGDGWWIGWPGSSGAASPSELESLDASLRERRLMPVYLSDGEVDAFYKGFSNEVLWPLFHYLLDRVRLDGQSDFDGYRAVNEKFADVVAAAWRPGDSIWVHDYQLALLPGMLRARLPEARIGFFLHIPFPSAEVFRILPARRDVLEGILGADLVGFHCFSYVRHFAAAVLRVLGAECDIDRIEHDGRTVRLGVHPMSVDAAELSRLAESEDVLAALQSLRGEEGDRKVILGIDRLDYTKGVPRRLLAIDRLLELEPSLAGRFRFVQVLVPSRAGVAAYDQLKATVEEMVGRINGKHARLDWSPIRYLHRSVTKTELIALYRLADVMLVTPLRDGMNLVAKEYIASRTDGDGVLVLSEFAGASEELGAALRVNPYDVDGTARSIQQALSMPPEERGASMRALREQVLRHDVHAWAAGFLRELDAQEPESPGGRTARPIPPADLARLALERGNVILLLDYDGTLAPHAARPDEAQPDEDLLRLLSLLAGIRSVETHVVSGRTRGDLEQWLGRAGVTLHAEHGLFSRRPGERWQPNLDVAVDWMPRVRQVLERLSAATTGSFIEEKSAGMAWHYRCVEPELGAARAQELRQNLSELTANQPVQVVPGKKLVEVRCTGVTKALVVRSLGAVRENTSIVAVGDDRTDEDMFGALPPDAITVRVDAQPTMARLRLRGVRDVRAFLAEIVRAGGSGG